MKKAARLGHKLSVESFADAVWSVPLQGRPADEPNGRLLHRASGCPGRARRIVLLRSFEGVKSPEMLVY